MYKCVPMDDTDYFLSMEEELMKCLKQDRLSGVSSKVVFNCSHIDGITSLIEIVIEDLFKDGDIEVNGCIREI